MNSLFGFQIFGSADSAFLFKPVATNSYWLFLLEIKKMLSKTAIQEFTEIYERKFGEKISEQAAFELANNYINFYRVIARPIKEGDEHENKSQVKL